MKYAIIGIIILVAFWKGRPYLKGLILKLVDKNKNKLKEVKQELIYTPVLSSRTFYFAIEISELGDGKASISVIKPKDLQEK